MIEIDKYRFSLHTKKGNQNKTSTSRWRCSTHHHLGCKATFRMVGDEVVSINNEHDHEPKPSRGKIIYC